MSKGGTKKNRLDTLAKSIEEEIAENWNPLGISPQNFNADQFYLHCMALAFFRVLKDVMGQDEEDMNIILKEVMLEELVKLREHIAPQVKQARLAALQQAIVPQIVPPWEKGNGQS